jgi:hypothetical protein
MDKSHRLNISREQVNKVWLAFMSRSNLRLERPDLLRETCIGFSGSDQERRKSIKSQNRIAIHLACPIPLNETNAAIANFSTQPQFLDEW